MKNVLNRLAAGILCCVSLGVSASDGISPSQDAVVSSIYITYDGTFEVGPGSMASVDQMY